MRSKTLLLIATLYVITLCSVSCGQDAASVSSLPAESAPAPQEEAAARQLRIYREALLQGTSDAVRVDAALSLLLQDDEASREVLIAALKGQDNPAARQSVCSALVKSRVLSQTIKRDEYLEPLLAILSGPSADQAKIAAEALLLFEYPTIEPELRKLIENKALDRQVRIQVIDALQLRPEPQSLRMLISLLDDSDPEVARSAENALQESFGIPVGTSRTVWADILLELQQKSPEDIRRERLLRQETRLREALAERDRWQKLFLSSIDRQYEMSDEAGRVKMIQEAMASDLVAMRLWTLDKITKLPVAAAELLKAPLLTMLSDPSRDVRLQTAKSLTNMSALNPAEKLLEQFKLEKDPELSLAMFEALGEACFFAYSPGSGIELPAEIKLQTLEIATEYLNNEAADRVKKGAEVIRKLLELNKLPEGSARDYLGRLYQRYDRSKEQPALRAELLAVMAHLCGQGNLRQMACDMYAPLFVEALADKDNAALRLSGAKGLSYADKSRALELFRSLGLNKDESLAVQQVVIELTGQVGDAEDLNWLTEGMLNDVQSEQRWIAVKSICQRQTSAFLMSWVNVLPTPAGVTSEEIRQILEIIESKAEVENEQAVLNHVRQRLIAVYSQRKSWEQGAAYLAKIGYSPESIDFMDETKMETMTIYLYSNQAEKAIQELESRLSKSDIDEESPWYCAMKAYFLDESITSQEKGLVLERAEFIQIPDRPQWASLVEELREWVHALEDEETVPKEIDTPV